MTKRKPKQPKPRKFIRRRTPKKAREQAAYNKRVKEWLKGKVCLCDTLIVAKQNGFHGPVCSHGIHPATECHHSRGRLGPLLMAEENWIPLCSTAHRWVHENIELARKMGLICPKGEWNCDRK